MTNQQNERSNNGKRIVLIMLAILLIAAIAFGAYTYAKYVTSKEGTGSATVAQWGYTVTIGDTQTHTDDFGFSKNYSYLGQAQGSATGAVISTVRSNNVVAPGAKGSFTFSIEGTAEVDAQLTASIAKMKDIYITVENGGTTLYYFPVLFNVTGAETKENLTLWELKTWAEGFTKKLEAGNTDYSTAKEYTVSWDWDYSVTNAIQLYTVTDDAESGYTIAKYTTVSFDATAIDTLDTALGYLAAGKSVAQTTITDITEGSKKNWTIQTTTADQSFTPEASDYSFNIGFNFSLSLTQVMEQA